MSADVLPEGWTRVKFGDVVRNVNENSRDLEADGIDRVVGLDHLDPGSLRLVRWDKVADLSDGTTFTRRFKPGQVLFGKRRAYQRKVAVPDFEGVCSGDILVFEPADKRMLADFLPYLVQSDGFFDHALGTSAGSLSPRTKWAELAKFECALPPVEVQQQLAALLSACDLLGGKYRSVVTAIERLKGTVVDAASARSTDTTNLRAIGKLRRGSRSQVGGPESVDRSVPFVKVAGLSGADGRGAITTGQSYLSAEEISSMGLEVLPVGTVLFQRVGASLREDRRRWLAVPACVDENILALVPEYLESARALHALLEKVSLKHIFQEGTVPSLNERTLGGVEVPVVPHDRMLELERAVSALSVLRLSTDLAMDRLDRLRASILQTIFGAGGSRVQ